MRRRSNRRLAVALAATAALFSLTSWIGGGGVALANRGFLGTWCGSSQQAYTIVDFPRLVVKQGAFDQTYAHYSGSQFVAERWAQTGTLSSDANKIVWSDGNAWVRTTNGAQWCGLMAQTVARAATPAPPDYRYLTGAHTGDAPIEYVGYWTTINDTTKRGYTCLSFKNASSVTATRVLFVFTLADGGKRPVDSGEIDRKGTFSPNVEIHGWHSHAAWANGQGRRDYTQNCMSWRPDNHAQALEYPYLRYFYVRVERIDYADGTAWTAPAGSPSP